MNIKLYYDKDNKYTIKNVLNIIELYKVDKIYLYDFDQKEYDLIKYFYRLNVYNELDNENSLNNENELNNDNYIKLYTSDIIYRYKIKSENKICTNIKALVNYIHENIYINEEFIINNKSMELLDVEIRIARRTKLNTIKNDLYYSLKDNIYNIKIFNKLINQIDYDNYNYNDFSCNLPLYILKNLNNIKPEYKNKYVDFCYYHFCLIVSRYNNFCDANKHKYGAAFLDLIMNFENIYKSYEFIHFKYSKKLYKIKSIFLSCVYFSKHLRNINFIGLPDLMPLAKKNKINLVTLVIFDNSVFYENMMYRVHQKYNDRNELIFYICCDPNQEEELSLKNNIFYVKCDETRNNITYKTLVVIRYIKYNYNPDLILRTNISTVVNYSLIYDYFERNIHKINKYLYAGPRMFEFISFNKFFVGGMAVFFNREGYNHLLDYINDIDPEVIDDQQFAIIFFDKFINPRVVGFIYDNLDHYDNINIINLYWFYRNKNESNRLLDIYNIINIYEMITTYKYNYITNI